MNRILVNPNTNEYTVCSHKEAFGLILKGWKCVTNDSTWAVWHAFSELRCPWHQVKQLDFSTVHQIHTTIAEQPVSALEYAEWVLNQPWHLASDIDRSVIDQAHQSISNCADTAFDYAGSVLRQPWHQAEGIDPAIVGQAHQSIATSTELAYHYATTVSYVPWDLLPNTSFSSAQLATCNILGNSVLCQQYQDFFALN